MNEWADVVDLTDDELRDITSSLINK